MLNDDEALRWETNMCLFCVEIAKQSMTTEEIGRALTEFVPSDEEHWEDIAKVLEENYDEQDVIESYFEVINQQIDKEK